LARNPKRGAAAADSRRLPACRFRNTQRQRLCSAFDHAQHGLWAVRQCQFMAPNQRHWDASDASDFKVEHEIYREDAVLDYPQSGERIRGRHNIQESRFVQPNKKHFTVRRIIGSGDLWVTEFVLTYDGIPSYAVSIMEFREGLVANETQYFADRFDPGPSRAHLVERVGEITSF
jgi:SnoaL-like domain